MSMCLAISSSWGQNLSNGFVLPTSTSTSTINGSPIETFRFGPKLVTQSDFPGTGNPFGFEATKQWFSIGRLNVGGTLLPDGTTTPQRTLYGMRLQRAGQGLTMGYSGSLETTAPTEAGNPFIEWIGNTGLSAGNLEFFTAPNPSLPNSKKLAFTLRSNLTALFGETSNFISTSTTARLFPKVEINSNSIQSLFAQSTSSDITASFLNNGGGNFTINLSTGEVSSNATSINATAIGATTNNGLIAEGSGGFSNIGVRADAVTIVRPQGRISSNYGIFSTVTGSTLTGSINCGIYATATGFSAVIPVLPDIATTGTYAGYFNGLVYSTTQIATSDSSLKKDIKPELLNIEKLSKLNPVTYNYIQNN